MMSKLKIQLHREYFNGRNEKILISVDISDISPDYPFAGEWGNGIWQEFAKDGTCKTKQEGFDLVRIVRKRKGVDDE